jgi:hypothetical protein
MTENQKFWALISVLIYLCWLTHDHETTFFFWWGMIVTVGVLYAGEIRHFLMNIR